MLDPVSHHNGERANGENADIAHAVPFTSIPLTDPEAALRFCQYLARVLAAQEVGELGEFRALVLPTRRNGEKRKMNGRSKRGQSVNRVIAVWR